MLVGGTIVHGRERDVAMRLGARRARCAMCLCLLATGVSAGCGDGFRRLFAHRSPHETGPAVRRASAPAPVPVHAPSQAWGPVTAMGFDVVRFDLPVDDIHHARKVWNHADELRVDADRIALLVRNGLRVGVVSEDSWPALQAIFEACGAGVGNAQQLYQALPPLVIEVDRFTESETVMWHQRDGRLTGRTFAGGERRLIVDYAHHPELNGRTDVGVKLEIRRERGELVWERRGAAIVQVPAYDRQTFDDLAVALTLSPGEFLVIGPSEEADNPYIVGSRFFTGKSDGRPFESVLCLTPRPVAPTGQARRRP